MGIFSLSVSLSLLPLSLTPSLSLSLFLSLSLCVCMCACACTRASKHVSLCIMSYPSIKIWGVHSQEHACRGQERMQSTECFATSLIYCLQKGYHTDPKVFCFHQTGKQKVLRICQFLADTRIAHTFRGTFGFLIFVMRI